MGRVNTQFASLRALRAERGLSVRELGRRAGVSAGLVSLIERGMLVPRPDQVDQLASALDLGGWRPRLKLEFGWERPA